MKSRTTAEEQIYITGAELRRRLSISRSTLYRHQLTRYALRVGSSWRYLWPAVVRHYENARGNGGSGKKN